MKTLIGIPARYGSTRFPGKPLAKIAGKEMLLRVVENAKKLPKNLKIVRLLLPQKTKESLIFVKQIILMFA